MKQKKLLYQIIISAILILVTLCMILPLILLFISSITEENTLIVYGYSFFPRKLSLASYRYILSNAKTIIRAYGITIAVTLIGTIGHISLTALMAYPLSLKNFPGKRIFSFYVLFTMLFNGGLVPTYIMWTNMFHIKDTIWAYILPNFLLSGFNIILVRTFFQTSIPPEIYEAAMMDGAGHFTIFRRIVLPLGKPILVTVGLFAGLTYWNDWTNGLYYITDSKLLSIQSLLNKMTQDIQALSANSSASGAMLQIPQVGVRMAIAFVAIFPILVIYPFLQKYFAKGIALGAVKG